MFDVYWLAMMLLFTGSKYSFSWGSDEGGVDVDEVGDNEWEPIKQVHVTAILGADETLFRIQFK